MMMMRMNMMMMMMNIPSNINDLTSDNTIDVALKYSSVSCDTNDDDPNDFNTTSTRL